LTIVVIAKLLAPLLLFFFFQELVVAMRELTCDGAALSSMGRSLLV
jgi:hypothetical protein